MNILRWAAAGAAIATAGALAQQARLTARARAADAGSAPPRARRDGTPLIGATTTIARPPADIQALWRDPARFADIMAGLIKVEPQGDGRQRWTIEGPMPFSLDVTIREDSPGRIAWEAAGSPARHLGQVSFTAGRRGTIVRLDLLFDPPGGKAGLAIATAAGAVTGARDPRRLARRALKQAKMLLETGEIARSPDHDVLERQAA